MEDAASLLPSEVGWPGTDLTGVTIGGKAFKREPQYGRAFNEKFNLKKHYNKN